MSLTRVQGNFKDNGGSVTSDTIVLNGVAAGDMLFAACRFGDGSAPVVLSAADNNGNAWTKDDQVNDTGVGYTLATFRAFNVNAGNTTITLSVSGVGGNSLRGCAIEYSGATTTDPWDSGITARTATGASTAPSVTATGTTAQASETLIVACANANGTTFAAGSGYTFNTADTNTGDNTAPKVAVEIKGLTVTTASPVGNGTLGASNTWDIFLGAFKEAGAAAGVPARQRALTGVGR